jgi:alcohol dehydrogenase class IV/choline kinase
MKALIFNSGIGHRMGDITKSHPKCMTTLLNHETIFGRQLRLLSEEGIKDFVITTGPFPEQLHEIALPFEKKGCHFQWVQNPVYAATNYIYSCYCARQYLYDEDLITLHGDLVFSRELLRMVLLDKNPSLCLINKKLPKPDKDFKGRVVNGKLREVGIGIFDEDCYTFQPLYKLAKKDAKIWLDSIIDFVETKKITNVYAENALNVVSSQTNIVALSYEGLYINEIDDPNDYSRVEKEIESIDYREQPVLYGGDSLLPAIKRFGMKKPLFVIDSFLSKNTLVTSLVKESKGVIFSSFQPNPLYDDVLKGIKAYLVNGCDSLISIGGGSAIDTAKAIKLFLPLDCLKGPNQAHVYTSTKHIAIPTTAGTGSESTRFSVVYYKGDKQSLTDDILLPDVAVLDISFLRTLPLNQKKATIFDALCHSVESMWSVNSTDESRNYALQAITIILKNIEEYLGNSSSELCLKDVMKAANLAGKAINIGQTTLAHAMCYKLTSEYHIPHGQAAIICLPSVWRYLSENIQKCNDPRGIDFVKEKLSELNHVFQQENDNGSIECLSSLLNKHGIKLDKQLSDAEIKWLASSVNPIRVKNYPITVDITSLSYLYRTLKY